MRGFWFKVGCGPTPTPPLPAFPSVSKAKGIGRRRRLASRRPSRLSSDPLPCPLPPPQPDLPSTPLYPLYRPPSLLHPPPLPLHPRPPIPVPRKVFRPSHVNRAPSLGVPGRPGGSGRSQDLWGSPAVAFGGPGTRDPGPHVGDFELSIAVRGGGPRGVDHRRRPLPAWGGRLWVREWKAPGSRPSSRPSSEARHQGGRHIFAGGENTGGPPWCTPPSPLGPPTAPGPRPNRPRRAGEGRVGWEGPSSRPARPRAPSLAGPPVCRGLNGQGPQRVRPPSEVGAQCAGG